MPVHAGQEGGDVRGHGLLHLFGRPRLAPAHGSWAAVPDPYRALLLSEEGRWRIAWDVSHGHEAWESCQACLVSEVMET